MEKNIDKSKWEPSVEALKSIIAKTGLVETLKWGVPTYTCEGKNLIGINAFKDYVGIWFFNGVFLKDESKKLVDNATTAKAMRQWRFTSVEEILNNEQLILSYVEESIDNQRSGLVLKPEKKETVISDFFQQHLDSDAAFAEAFSKFTPGKQREFTEHIDGAKREDTKHARMDKIKPMVLAGIGLHDKYR